MRHALIFRPAVGVMAVWCVLRLTAAGAPLLNESFGYPVGALHTVSSNVWSTQGSSNDVVTVVDGNLSYAGLYPAAGRMVSYGGTGDSAVVKLGPLSSSSYSNGVLYYALLMNVAATNGMITSAAAGQNNYVAGFHKSAGNTGTAFIQVRAATNAPAYHIGLGYASSGIAPVWDPTALATGATVMVVVQYEFVTGPSNDVVRLWLNPSAATLGATSTPPASLVLTNTAMADVSPLSVFQLDQKPTIPSAMRVDEFRLGFTWPDVTPPDPGLSKVTGRTVVSVH